MGSGEESKLLSFNKKFGYARRLSHPGPNGNSERAICSIPWFPILANCGNNRALMKQQPHITVRIIMSSTFVCIPAVIVLDLVGTIITHPMQTHREAKAAKEIQVINPSASFVRPPTEQKKKRTRKPVPDESSSLNISTQQVSSTAESLAGISTNASSSLESSS
jgi:hypothetical protein